MVVGVPKIWVQRVTRSEELLNYCMNMCDARAEARWRAALVSFPQRLGYYSARAGLVDFIRVSTVIKLICIHVRNLSLYERVLCKTPI